MSDYRERVLPSVSNLALIVILWLSVFAVMLPIQAAYAVPVAFLASIAFAGFQFFSSPVLEITNSTLKAKGAEIERKFVSHVEVIKKSEILENMGPKLDARAWMAIQPSIKGLVRVTIDDPNDPTPYWMISTRNPQKVAELLDKN